MNSLTANNPAGGVSSIWAEAIVGSLRKLDPREQIKNPVIFIAYICAVASTVLICHFVERGSGVAFVIFITVWLWLTVIFSNFAEALAEGKGRARAKALRSSRMEVSAKKLERPERDSRKTIVKSSDLKKEDYFYVEANDIIPADGEIVMGAASVDESAITGESAPVIRESGGDRSAVTGGTRILSDWLVVRVTSGIGESFLDRMIGMVEGAKRQRTPNERALDIFLAGLTIVLLLASVTLIPFSKMIATSEGGAAPDEIVSLIIIIALIVCLIPTTIGALLSAIRIAGMDRLIRANVVVTSGRAVEAAGDVNVLLLDKTGTITIGNRQASAFFPAEGISIEQLADYAQLASLADETPEGRSIVILAKTYKFRERDLTKLGARFIAFSAQTRMSGVDVAENGNIIQIRKGAPDAVRSFVERLAGTVPESLPKTIDEIARRGSTPLMVAKGNVVLGCLELKDIIKGGTRERFSELRTMGIKTVMITGDNPVTAATIAAEAGVDDFLANATPERKLILIKEYQTGGRLVAMTGDGTNDAPALAQADVAVAMNSGTQAAKEAGNMIDLDSNPTKLIEIVHIGKQLLITRGALTTFSIANDVAKYFAIIPAAFTCYYPELTALNIMGLATRGSAVASSIVFNALIIPALIPVALRGVSYKPSSASSLLLRNVLIYGIGGVIAPFVGIKLIDMIFSATGFANLLII